MCEQVLATLQSRKFLRQFIDSKKLLPVLFEEIWDEASQSWFVQSQEDEPTEQKAVDAFKKILSVDEDKKSGLISLSISWAIQQLRLSVRTIWSSSLNEQLREQAIADSQKRVGYLEQELAKTTLQDMRAVLYNLLEVRKTESHACQCKRGLCPRSNRPRCYS